MDQLMYLIESLGAHGILTIGLLVILSLLIGSTLNKAAKIRTIKSRTDRIIGMMSDENREPYIF